MSELRIDTAHIRYDSFALTRLISERWEEVTSPTHEGRIAMMNPDESWVAKWQRGSKFAAGLYAARVAGRLPDDIIEELEGLGVEYRARDGSHVD